MKKMTYGPDPSTVCKHWDVRRNRRALRVAIAVLLMSFLAIAVRPQDLTTPKISVLTYHYDNMRTGQDTHETLLTHSNVNTNQFGRLFVRTDVQGQIVGQPLYMPGLSILGGTHNVVFVATNAAMVYAFDADSNTSANAKPLWQASLIDTAQEKTADFARGVTSTPVIDASTSIMYVEAKSRLINSATYFHRLHALDILTGKEKSFSPVPITGTYAGVNFNSTIINEMNRPGLLLADGIVYTAFASDCGDFGKCGGTTAVNYYGWIFAYNAANLQQEGVFNTTPKPGDEAGQAGGGIWMSGAGLAADNSTPTANVFFSTGNGESDPTATSPTNFADSILKLGLTSTTLGAIAPDQDLKLLDWFTPFDEEKLETDDLDLGSGGVLLLPDQSSTPQHLLVQAGKGGFSDPKPCQPPAGSCFAPIHVLNRDQLTINNQHFCPPPPSPTACTSDTNIHQEIPNAVGGMWSMPAYWNNTVYFWGNNDTLKGYALSNSRLSTTPVVTSSDTYPRAANMSISANGATNGIVWAAETGSNPLMILNAYNAGNGQLLYSSAQNQGRDNAGGDVHFIVPMVANGKVYLGGTQLSVYGLNPADFTLSIVPASQFVIAGGTVSFTLPITTVNNFSADVSLTLNGCPPLATCTVTGDPIAASTSTSGSATLTVATQFGTPLGFYPITVTASGGDITHSQTAILEVR